MFTCLVELRQKNINNDDVQWDHMGNTLSINPYMVKNDITNGATQLNSTLIITNVRREHVGPYQFVLDLNDGDVMSRRATLTVLIGTQIFQCLCLFLCVNYVCINSIYNFCFSTSKIVKFLVKGYRLTKD